MERLLPRGYPISENDRLGGVVAQGENWQIYRTGRGLYALAAAEKLCGDWEARFPEVKDILVALPAEGCRLFPGSEGYLTSSLEQGPYPETIGQVEAFSIAFGRAGFSPEELSGALYLEKYSLLLPALPMGETVPPSVAYGRWLAGGARIPAEDFDRLCRAMSWAPRQALARALGAAGFEPSGPISPGGAGPVARSLPGREKEEVLPGRESLPSRPADLPREPFSLPGRPGLERFFRENILEILEREEEYRRMGVPFPGAVLLYGPPGCGKTFAVERLAEYLGWPRFEISSESIGSPYIHETGQKIGRIFRQAMEAAPSILIIDEMEAFLSGREQGMGPHHDEEVAEFLRRIPEASAGRVLVFAMTNLLERIDPALLRRGRFDHLIQVEPASAEEICQLLRARLAKLPTRGKPDPERLAARLAGRPLSDVDFVLRQAGRLAVRGGLEGIDEDCLLTAAAQLQPKKERARIGFMSEREDGKRGD